MALQVWLPLNGNLNNNGLTQLTSSGTPTFLNNGKLGQCISLNPRITFNGLPKLNNFTIAFWLKVDNCTSDWADDIGFKSVQKDGTAASDFRFEATKTSRACSFHNNSPFAISNASRILITEAQKGEWHHCCVSYNGTNLYTYIDGVLTYTDTGLGGYLIDRFHIGEGSMTGGMNDLRIYNECLSQKQIKEISKGLVAHYKLSMPGSDNLATNTFTASPSGFHDYTGKATTSIISDSDVFTSVYKIDFPVDTVEYSNYNLYTAIPRDSSAVAKDGRTYTLSFKIKASKALSSYEFFYEFNSASKRINVTTEWQTVVLTGAATSQYAALYVCRGKTDRSKINGGSLYIAEIKLELGNRATPWLPNKADALYSQLGYDKILSQDVSGYQRYLTGLANLYSDMDTPRYLNAASKITTTEPVATIPTIFTNGQTADQITLAGWYKTSTASGGTKNIICLGQNSFIRFGPSTATNVWTYAKVGSTMVTFNCTVPTITDNLWHHYVVTFNKGIFKCYLDGVLKGTQDSSATGKYLTCSSTTNYIGAYSATGECLPGSFSDIRIYSTALSAADILTLYKTSGIIDNKGNIYAYEFVEEN